jgi:hypothetical protein
MDGHVASMRAKDLQVFVKKPNLRDHVEGLGVIGWIILKRILKE